MFIEPGSFIYGWRDLISKVTGPKMECKAQWVERMKGKIQATNSLVTSTDYDCLGYHLCCNFSFRGSQIENASDSCSYCASSRKSRTWSASTNENAENGNESESKISPLSD